MPQKGALREPCAPLTTRATKARRLHILVRSEQANSVCCNAFSRPCKAQSFLGGSLNVNAGYLDLKSLRNVLSHGVDMGAHLGRLSENRGIYVLDIVELLLEQIAYVLEELDAVGAFVALVGIGEVKPDIAKSGSAEKRIHNGVGKDIRIGVSEESLLVRDIHAAYNELTAFRKLVNIVTVSYSHLHPFGCFKSEHVYACLKHLLCEIDKCNV